MVSQECYTITGVHFNYGKNNVLNDISVRLPGGKFYGLVGPNGCGKTTLIDVLVKNKNPIEGSIKLFGSPLGHYSRKKLAKHIALVPQNFYINFAFSIEEIVLMGRNPYIARFSMPSAEDMEKVERALVKTDIESLRNKYITALSGGERQRVVFARALAQDAQVLLLDEATSNLDIKHTLNILDIVLRQVKTQQRTVIAVFHDLNLAAHYCDYLLFMKEGSLVVHGETHDVFTEGNISAVFEVDSKITHNGYSGSKQVTFKGGRSSKKILKALLPLLCIFALLFFIFYSMPAMSGQQSIMDDSGQYIEFDTPFKRIISLYGAHTENLFFLGLDEEIIGVSKYEAYPRKARTKPIYSYHDDAEKFIAARPDLILIRPMIFTGYRKFVEKLQRAGIVIVSLQPTGVEGIYEYWAKLGALTGREQKAKAMITTFQTGLDYFKSKLRSVSSEGRKQVYFESIHSKMKTFAPQSIAAFVLKSAGGINVADDAKTLGRSNIADYGKERILAKAGRIDFYLAQEGVMNKVTKQVISREAGFQAIKAVKEDRIYIIDEMIVSRPTMRLLEGIYRIGNILYPHVFNSKEEFVHVFYRND